MNARDPLMHSNAIEHPEPRQFRLNVDERVALIAITACLSLGLYFGLKHPEQQVPSCYQSQGTK